MLALTIKSLTTILEVRMYIYVCCARSNMSYCLHEEIMCDQINLCAKGVSAS